MDNEFAFMFALAQNSSLKGAVQTCYMRSPDILCVRSKDLQAFAASKGLAIEWWDGEQFFLYPKDSTRKRPAGIIVSPGFVTEDIEGAIYMEYLGVGTLQVVEKGNVRVGRVSQATAVRREAQSLALC